VPELEKLLTKKETGNCRGRKSDRQKARQGGVRRRSCRAESSRSISFAQGTADRNKHRHGGEKRTRTIWTHYSKRKGLSPKTGRGFLAGARDSIRKARGSPDDDGGRKKGKNNRRGKGKIFRAKGDSRARTTSGRCFALDECAGGDAMRSELKQKRSGRREN